MVGNKMKITKTYLKQLIKEELDNLSEQPSDDSKGKEPRKLTADEKETNRRIRFRQNIFSKKG